MESKSQMFCRVVRAILKIELQREYRFHQVRKFRFDFAIPEHRIAIEMDGGVWMKGGGRHNRPAGFLKDMEKFNLAATMGWRVVRVTPRDLLTSRTLDMIRDLVNV